MSRDWTGNSNSIFKTLGASNHTDTERQIEDYYATEPKATELLMKMESFKGPVWEPACGQGHMSKVLASNGLTVVSSDLIDRGFGQSGYDFLSIDNTEWNGDIITNPPYKYAQEFIEKSLQIIPKGHKVAMFLKLTFMESKGRKHLFTHFPPKVIHVSCERLLCSKNGEFNASEGKAVAYAWYVWEKGFKGTTELKWFN